MGACIECKEQITNPLSPQRLTEQMTTWLVESKPELVTEFRTEAHSLLNRDVTSNDYCIISGKPMNVCVYCFSEHAFRWFDAQELEKELMNEYVTFFDFDITGKGYIKEYMEHYADKEDTYATNPYGEFDMIEFV